MRVLAAHPAVKPGRETKVTAQGLLQGWRNPGAGADVGPRGSYSREPPSQQAPVAPRLGPTLGREKHERHPTLATEAAASWWISRSTCRLITPFLITEAAAAFYHTAMPSIAKQ